MTNFSFKYEFEVIFAMILELTEKNKGRYFQKFSKKFKNGTGLDGKRHFHSQFCKSDVIFNMPFELT